MEDAPRISYPFHIRNQISDKVRTNCTVAEALWRGENSAGASPMQFAIVMKNDFSHEGFRQKLVVALLLANTSLLWNMNAHFRVHKTTARALLSA
jgi:hypothetical protein